MVLEEGVCKCECSGRIIVNCLEMNLVNVFCGFRGLKYIFVRCIVFFFY